MLEYRTKTTRDYRLINNGGRIMNEELIKKQKMIAERAEELYTEGKKLIAQKEFDKAYEYFRESYKMYPRNYTVCFKLFVQSIRNMKYDEAFEYFDALFATSNPYSKMDNNFYLYLLNVITDIPDKYKEYVGKLTKDDIKVNSHDFRYQDATAWNKIRFSAMQGKYTYAIYLLNELNGNANAITIQASITKILLSQAADVEKISRDTLMELTKSKRYNEIIDFLEKKESKQSLSIIDRHVLKVVRQIVDIQNTGIVPEVDIFETKYIREAINAHNYELALSMCKEYNKEHNIVDENNILYLLLVDICELVKKVSLDEEDKIENISLANIINFLINYDLDKAFRILPKYLKSINKESYEFLIISLIKISLIEKDMAFTKPIFILINMDKGVYIFNVIDYIQQYYTALSQNDLEEAEVYLDIIEKSKVLEETSGITDSLLQTLREAKLVRTSNFPKRALKPNSSF